MLKQKKIKKFLQKAHKPLKKIPVKGFARKTLLPLKSLFGFLCSWWHVLSGIAFVIFFLYYPIGAFMMEKINRDTTIEIPANINGGSNVITTMSELIDSEVNKSFWTPSLPFIFPSYILDNMPNFQLGKMSAISKFAYTLNQNINQNLDNNLSEAVDLLQYPGTIWMFSPEKRVAPSSASQYRRARKELIKYNNKIENGIYIFPKTSDVLSSLIKSAYSDLNKSVNELEKHIRENSGKTFDSKADDVFFYHQGKIYSYYMLFKALSYDYKDIIVAHQIYPSWVKMLKSMEDGANIAPLIIRNEQLNSSIYPNHLHYLSYYNLRASKQMQSISAKLDKGI
ncbi:MAG: DUF2333 family protein [Lactobacillus sp.]|jgi:hypothetical protein|nr:DUF2333 family protein [Lactobacillus sp.]